MTTLNHILPFQFSLCSKPVWLWRCSFVCKNCVAAFSLEIIQCFTDFQALKSNMFHIFHISNLSSLTTAMPSPTGLRVSQTRDIVPSLYTLRQKYHLVILCFHCIGKSSGNIFLDIFCCFTHTHTHTSFWK